MAETRPISSGTLLHRTVPRHAMGTGQPSPGLPLTSFVLRPGRGGAFEVLGSIAPSARPASVD